MEKNEFSEVLSRWELHTASGITFASEANQSVNGVVSQ
jgi:hypothetical protein